ncbi:TetR/AcrR family transcriptional regulator [Caulobacter zeae]|uniref:TetR/AcrR family transcriptional regulator n=1 Tax=Caulobacter zeae TaxID=2055137 RepID=A0A2N5DPC5_9CAUL|nr:TetR/AcrR family transcriptional regulator [Caulobacter zeae]PLR27923.1 TetR/AcrR family transcriptional regulator [Caulobacter zeae]
MRYEKGHRDASRERILQAASERFRADGIAASGLARVMKDAGLTNGAFYPHFESKAELVRESLVAALDAQADQMRQILAADGLEGLIAAYLSPRHRDNPQDGCATSALAAEIAREPQETRSAYTERVAAFAELVAAYLPPHTTDREAAATALLATCIGTLQIARAVDGTEMSDRILAAGQEAARTLLRTSASSAT